MRKSDCKKSQYNAEYRHKKKTLFKYVLQFIIVSCTVVISYYRSNTDRITGQHGDENKVYIHYNSVCGNSVFASHIHKTGIVYHAYNGNGYIGYKFRRAVRTRFKKHFKFAFCFTDTKQTVILTGKIYDRN